MKPDKPFRPPIIDYRNAKVFLLAGVSLGAVVSVLSVNFFDGDAGELLLPGKLILGIGAAIILASLFLYHRYNVCPHCGWLLPSRTLLIPTYCPECGKKLSDLPE